MVVGQSMRLGAGVDALVSQRSRGHLIYRVVARVYGVNAALPLGPRPRQAAALALGLAADVGQWTWLRRRPGSHLGPRLVMDAVDVWAFSRTVDPSPEAAMLTGVPLAAEAGARYGVIGLGVPVFQLAVATATRQRSGRPTPVASALPQAQAAVFGAACGAYSRRSRRQIVDEHRREIAAHAEAAELSGQLEVALDASAVVDQVSGIEYLVAVAGEKPVGEARSLARWKASLAAAPASDNSFLRVVASRWEATRRTNALGDDVQLDIDEPTGSVVLTRTQASQLVDALDALAPQGRCAVRTSANGIPRLIGESVQITVGDFDVKLRPDDDPVRRIEPAPAMIFGGAGWCLAMAATSHGGVPLRLAAGASLGSVALAAWAHAGLRSVSPPDPEVLVALAVGVATAQALLGTATLGSPRDHDGVQVFPAALTLMGPAFLAGRYHQTFDRAAQIRMLALFGASIGVSLLPARRPIEWAHAAAGVAELLAAYLLLSRIQGALNDDQLLLEEQFDEDRQAEAIAAYATGRRRAIDLVDGERKRLLETVEAAHGDAALTDDLDRELRRRLVEVDRALAMLGARS